jgi:hypothetical protein
LFIEYDFPSQMSTLDSAGVLGSSDSITGAPENHAGEAVEQEASNFVASFTSIVVASAVEQESNNFAANFASIAVASAVGQQSSASLEKSIPDPTKVGVAKDRRSVHDRNDLGHDKTKEVMSAGM